ncbi:alpha/beta hydrolase [Streptomonospora litoralis]|uniref:Esterase n=1 Tax=Streptomonospora litoralis TaxID=2498135 RepID=A0A4P6PVK9_9ACTN|nr:alpha/beta hydrolase-fold protein [Streptomonospora litoralis]QBI52188.1 Putative esterase [Streptomonospora litoralis]
MFTTLSRRTAVLVASSLVVATAGTLAALRDEAPDTGGAAAQAAGAAMPPGASPVNPRPGEVASCDQSGTDKIITVPDKGAPDGKRPIWVRRPPGPDTDDLPVLYLLHGSTTTHHDIRDAGVGEALDKQMCRSGVEFVIAAPFGQEVGGSDTEWGDAADGDFAIETFVTEKAIKAVEGEHTRPRALRAIAGFSMGGYGAAALSLRHPDTYGQAVSWAGYFKVDDPSDTFGDNPDAHAPDQLLDDPAVRDIRYMLIEGEDDHTPLQTGSIHGEAERFAKLLRERDMTVETMHPEGGHTWETWVPTFPEAVDFLVEGWTAPQDPAARRGD